MEYKLITPTGKVYEFYSFDVAQMYKNIYGGEIVHEPKPEKKKKKQKDVAFNS